MRHPFCLFVLGWLFLLGGCADSHVDPAEHAQNQRQEPVALAKYLEVHRLKGASFSHDEKLVAYLSDEGGRLDVHIQPVAGGEVRRITSVGGRIWSFAFSPTRDQLLYEVDQGGNGKPRIYLTNSLAAEPVDLMPEVPLGSRIGFIEWAADGDSFLYMTNLPGKDFVEVFEYDMTSGDSEKIWKSPSNLSFSLASPGFDKIILQEVLSDVDFNLYLLRRGQQQPALITPHEGDIAYTPTAFSRDGETLYYTSTADGDFTSLRAMDLNTGESQLVLQDKWDVNYGKPSRGWSLFTTVTNANGTPQVKIREIDGGGSIELPALATKGALVPITFSSSDRYLAATLVSDTSPRTIYLIDLHSGVARELVDPLPEALRDHRMTAGEAVQISSFDGLEVPAFLYKPPGEGPFPAVIHVHGGPHSQAKRVYSGFRQYLVSKGYVVLVPNVRGSTGYGKQYTSLDNLDLGGGPLLDIIECKRWLVEHASVDEERVAIMGASYGGYMTLAAAAFKPGEFAAHVDYFGISDMKTLVESYPPYWKVYFSFTFKKWGDPNNPEHAEYQYQRSPINFTDQIEDPILVVQGENDARVPRDQSDRLVAALESRQVPVHYLVMQGEGHGFTKSESRLRAYEATDRFLARYLLGDSTVEILPPDSSDASSDEGELTEHSN